MSWTTAKHRGAIWLLAAVVLSPLACSATHVLATFSEAPADAGNGDAALDADSGLGDTGPATWAWAQRYTVSSYHRNHRPLLLPGQTNLHLLLLGNQPTVAQFDPTGQLLSVLRLGSPTWVPDASAAAVLADGELAMAGDFLTTDGVFVARTSGEKLLWARQINGAPREVAPPSAILPLADQGLLVAYEKFFNPEYFVLLRLSADGTLLWHWAYQEQPGYSGSIKVSGSALAATPSGFLLAGSIDARTHLLKLDADGTIVWQRQLYGRQVHGIVSLAGETAVIALDNQLIALDASVGTQLWRRRSAVANGGASLQVHGTTLQWAAQTAESTDRGLRAALFSFAGDVSWAGTLSAPLVAVDQLIGLVPQGLDRFVLGYLSDAALVLHRVDAAQLRPTCLLNYEPLSFEAVGENAVLPLDGPDAPALALPMTRQPITLTSEAVALGELAVGSGVAAESQLCP